jgi:hypothetical protein
MTLVELADLIRANSGNTNGRIDGIDARIDSMRNETNAALMNIQNDLTDVRGEIREMKSDLGQVRSSLDLASTVAAMRRQIETLAAEVAELKRRAS